MNNAEPIIRHIPGGTLTLRMEREDIPLDDALAFASRINPKRRFLFVSRVLGRHLPTSPAALRQAAARLAQKLTAPPQPCLFIGMAETATTLGQAVWREWLRQGGSPSLYLDTTRRATGGEIAFSFREDHSHAPLHIVHRPTAEDDPQDVFENAATLVIVDDEATTGRTACALADAYTQWRGWRPQVALLTLVHWKSGAAPAFPFHSLVEGTFDFTADDTAHDLPCEAGTPPPTPVRRGSRQGLVAPQVSPWADEPPGRVLVVGAGEFGFMPLLLAEQIEAAGGEAYVQATTRSPVLLGGAIGHVRGFPALDGSAYTEFLYNVPDDHSYDRVILCCESGLPPASHPLRKIPGLELRSIDP